MYTTLCFSTHSEYTSDPPRVCDEARVRPCGGNGLLTEERVYGLTNLKSTASTDNEQTSKHGMIAESISAGGNPQAVASGASSINEY